MDQPATAAVNDFIQAYCRRRPVNATFLGIREYGDLLPDFSPNGIADTIDEMEGLRSRLNGNSIDERLGRGFLAIEKQEFLSEYFTCNPALYTGEAIFGVLTSSNRLPSVAGFLAQARINVRSAPREWTLRAIQECAAAITILDRLPDSKAAKSAFDEYARYLAHEVLPKPAPRYGCGAEFFDLLMKEGHLMHDSTEDFLAFAQEEFESHRHARLPADAPVVHDLLQHQRCWDECRQFVADHGLLTWPEDFPLIFTRPPELVRGAAQDLYYLAYRAPAAFDPVLPHRCEVNPCGPITLKLNHVVHHAGPGHHVQNFYASRAPSLIGRIAAVDCASRIAMFSGGTMAEGWACYATDLMDEFGFLSPDERAHQEHTRLRMAARAIVDIRLHRFQMTFADAVSFYQTQVGMNESAATKEAVRNSMFPGTAMMYLLGTSRLHRLRQEVGSRMTLREFHDRLLSYGSIPVTLIGALMTGAETDR